MASIYQLIDRKLKRLHKAPDAFIGVVETQQKKVMETLIDAIGGLQTDAGVILVNDFNISRIPVIIQDMQTVFFDADYQEALTSFIGEFDAQAEVTRELLQAGIGELPTSEQLYNSLLRTSQVNASTLFGEAVIGQVYFQPLQEQLLLNITNGSSLKETIKALRLLTTNNAEADGLVYRYAKTYARTSFAQSDANYTTTLSRDMGVEWYKYAGSVIEGTREFCDTRHNKYYHVKEVEDWGNLKNWDGKIKGTNSSTIFANRGGWSCRHSLVPYSVLRIPKDVIQRNIKSGNYKPTEVEREELGL